MVANHNYHQIHRHRLHHHRTHPIHPSSSSFPISFCSNRKLSRITSLLRLPSSARPLLWQLRGQPKREASSSSSSSACSLGLCRWTDSRRALRGWIALRVAGRAMANLYVKAVPPADLNRNTEWFMYPGVWTTYILILFFSWLLVLSLTACSPGMAWTVVNLSHFLVTYHFFHWKKGTPFSEDQGIYNGLTWWEQMDNGKQLTRNRKFLTVVPVVLYLIASHTTDYQNPMLFLNTLAVIVLVVAKFPNMHKVRIFGINADK